MPPTIHPRIIRNFRSPIADNDGYKRKGEKWIIPYYSTVLERCEYDACGNCSILEPNFAPDPDGKSDYGNNYLFTGRRLDILDNGSLKIQYNRNRYYDYYTGRWLTQDPLGITPNPQKPNRFMPIGQYGEVMNLYEYAKSLPTNSLDPHGLLGAMPDPWPPDPTPGPEPLSLDCPDGGCPSGWLDPLPSTGSLSDWDSVMAFLHFLSGAGASVEFSHESTFAWRCSVPTPWTHGISSSFHNLSRELRRETKTIGMGIQPCKCANFGSSGIAAAGYGYVHGDWLGTLSLGRNDEYSTLYYRAKCCVKKICRDGTYKAKLVCRIRWDIYDLYTYEKVPVVRYLGDDYWQIVHFDKNLDVEIDLEN